MKDTKSGEWLTLSSEVSFESELVRLRALAELARGPARPSSEARIRGGGAGRRLTALELLQQIADGAYALRDVCQGAGLDLQFRFVPCKEPRD